jgi:predicted RNA-binding Zn-ribbon protein involved in translation (DUF1610 family)
MSQWTCASCGQIIVTEGRPVFKCATCIQTEAIEEQTRLLRQIHNIHEPEPEPSKPTDDSAVLSFVFVCFVAFLMWLFT